MSVRLTSKPPNKSTKATGIRGADFSNPVGPVSNLHVGPMRIRDVN